MATASSTPAEKDIRPIADRRPHVDNDLPDLNPEPKLPPRNLLELVIGPQGTDDEPQTGVYPGPGDLVVKTIRGEVKAKPGDSISLVPAPVREDPPLGLWVTPKEVADQIPPPAPPVESGLSRKPVSPGVSKTSTS